LWYAIKKGLMVRCVWNRRAHVAIPVRVGGKLHHTLNLIGRHVSDVMNFQNVVPIVRVRHNALDLGGFPIGRCLMGKYWAAILRNEDE